MAVSKEEPQDPTPYDVPAPEGAPSAEVALSARAAQDSMLNVMRDHYKTEKRVRVKVHSDRPVTVQVNGYSFLIREGVAVEVPESVADILDAAGYI